MLRAVAFVSGFVMYIFRIISDDCCLLQALESYPYEAMNVSGLIYPPPRQNDSSDQTCDCNSVMYKYEVQASEGILR